MLWTLLSLGAALLGHAVLCVQTSNRLHAFGWPRWAIRALTSLDHLWLVGVPAAYVWFGLARSWRLDSWFEASSGVPEWARAYALFSSAIALAWAPAWLWRRCTASEPAALLETKSKRLDLKRALKETATQGLSAKLYASLPLNEMLQLDIAEKTLFLPRWPQELDGLSIVHLSDLHFTGGIDRPFFAAAIEAANELQPEVVVLTGDVIDKARCLPWVRELLARVDAPLGKFFVLGNHDRRVDVAALRKELAAAGFVDASGRWQTVAWRGHDVVLAGNERPWFRPDPDMTSCPSRDGGPPRVLLTHTPDLISWARRHDFDLLLAGHTHGGQIRFPVTGPMLAPSRYGVRYASGTFHEPPVVMHVSRGVSSLQPLRWNCSPEIAKLVLRSPA